MNRPRDVARVNLPVLVALSVLVTAALTSVSGQAVDRAGQGQPGTAAAAATNPAGRITGQVVAADTGATIRRATVTVEGGTPARSPVGAGLVATAQLSVAEPGGMTMPAGMARCEVMTDEAGRFECANLPAGRFAVYVRATGPFLASQPRFLELADGAAASVTIRLERGGSITGRVLDDGGEPVTMAQVVAGERQSVNGLVRLVPGGSSPRATTNDLGEYRVFGLPPGDFIVSAVWNPPPLRTPSASPPGEPRYGLAPTFHPSTTAFHAARPVSVRAGQETGGVDVTLARVLLGSISGRVTDSTGAVLAARQVSVTLQARRNVSVAGPASFARWKEDGGFVIENVPPGQYAVVANVRVNDATPSVPAEAGFERVDVEGGEAVVQIQTNTGATVSGRIIVEGSGGADGWRAAGPPGASRAAISPRTAETGFSIPYSFRGPGSVAEDLTFTMTGLRGQMLISPFVPGAALKSVKVGANDITASGLLFTGTETIDDVTVTVTTDTATIEGTVKGGDGAPADAWIIVFPDDKSRWFPMSPFVRAIRPRPPGSPDPPTPAPVSVPGSMADRRRALVPAGGFRLMDLLPGRYAVAVVQVDPARARSGGSMPATDADALAALRRTARIVSVAAGETATVQLTVRK